MTVPDPGPVVDLARKLQEAARAHGDHLSPVVARDLARVALTYSDTEVTGDWTVPVGKARNADEIATAWGFAEVMLLRSAHTRGLAVVTPLRHAYERQRDGSVILRYTAGARTIIKPTPASEALPPG